MSLQIKNIEISIKTYSFFNDNKDFIKIINLYIERGWKLVEGTYSVEKRGFFRTSYSQDVSFDNESLFLKGYNYLKENRTFKYNTALIVNLFSKLTVEDLEIGTADNDLANSIKKKNRKGVIKNLKKSRTALEKRAAIKNQIDLSLKKIFKN